MIFCNYFTIILQYMIVKIKKNSEILLTIHLIMSLTQASPASLKIADHAYQKNTTCSIKAMKTCYQYLKWF